MNETDHDVLIVGAGPTGLTLAAQLLARGVRTRVIDKDAGEARLSRAIGIQPGTLEVLETMGIVDRFLDAGHVVRRLHVHAGATSLLVVDMAHCRSAYKFMLHLPQQRTEALLREHVTELGGTISRGVELYGFVDADDHVVATVRDASGRTSEVTASYLVGCDGAHSRVRHVLDVQFVGQPYPWDWILADARVDWSGRPDEVHVFSRPDGLPLLCVPITERLWRLSLPTGGDRGTQPPTLEEIQHLVDERGPGGIIVSEPENLTSFRCQIRSTSTYRRGRVLLAGDAAHIHSPAGGQGMNTGMTDAMNLAWKLGLVVAGRASERLLDSYGAERAPVAAGVLRFTQGMVRFGTMPRSFRRIVRDATLPAYRLPAVQRRLAGQLSQTSVVYPTGPLASVGHRGHGPRPGERMPDIALRTASGPGTLRGQLGNRRHVLLVPPDRTEADLAALGLDDHADLLVIASRVSRRASDEIVLVRPDGHVAAVARTRDPSSVRGYLNDLFPRPTFVESAVGGGPA